MIFVKLGGSLITHKDASESARLDVLQRLASELRLALDTDPALRILLGHGSGSFGHDAAPRHGTHRGASTPAEWSGFAEVWAVANRLNRMVIDTLRAAGLPALSIPPSASAMCDNGELIALASDPILHAIQAGLLPVVAGDVAFDRRRGSTIVSTERVFSFLAPRLKPTRVLLAGIEPGVYSDYPDNTQLLPTLSEAELEAIRVDNASTPDVTGGMADKVRHALGLVAAQPGLEVLIFSGEQPGLLTAALLGAAPGTRVIRSAD